MKDHEFLANVRERGSYDDQTEAEKVTRAVLGVLSGRLPGGESAHLAAQLPAGLQDAMPDGDAPAASYGVDEFVSRVATELDTTPEIGRWDASAVLTTVVESVTGGQLNQVLSVLPSGYAVLFGKPDLADDA